MKKDKLIDSIGNIKDEFIEEAREKKKFRFDWAFVGKLATAALCVFLVVGFIPNLFRTGKSSKGDYEEAYDTVAATEAPMEIPAMEEGGYGGVGNYAIDNVKAANTRLQDNKKLIVNGNLNLETLEFDSALDTLYRNVEKAGGYIQSSSISTDRNSGRYFNATIRIPADKYNDFLNETKASGNATWYNESVDDVTDSYTDLEARLTSLKAEEEKVLEFYNQATNLEELMSIESRLTDIRYEIDYIQNSLKNYDLLISYSTLNIGIQETKVYTKTNENFFSRIGLSFTNGWSNFVNTVENIVIDLVYNIWTILLIIVLVVIAIIVIKKIKNKRK